MVDEEFNDGESFDSGSDEFGEVETHSSKVIVGDEESDVYTEEGREVLVEDDEIEPWEEGFCEGAEGKGHLAVCAHCGKVLGDDENVFERKFHDILFRFCSEKCAGAGPKDV